VAYKKNGRPTILVLDGEVAASGWGEAVLSLLDHADFSPEAGPKATFLDNMSLRLPPSVKILLEVGQLRSATPALVARCAMLYVEDKDG